MRILIVSGKFGMGHWSASQSLRQQLLGEFPGAEIEIADLVDYAMPAASETVYKCFQLLVTRGSGLFNAFYRATEDIPTDGHTAFDWIFQDKLEALLGQWRPDAVIATHPFCAQLVSGYKEETGDPLPLVTCITDLSLHAEWISRNTDCYLVGSGSLRESLVARGVERERICVTGIPVKEQFKRISRRPAGGERRLLIMGGGLGLLPRRERFYEALNALPGVKTTLITGGNRKLFERLDGKYGHIEVLGFTDRVYEYMERADLMLSKPGGITLFESIFAELPMLAWEPFLEQERRNASFLVEQGMGRVAGREPEDCLDAVRALIYDDAALGSMAGNMRALKSQLEEEGLNRRMAALTNTKGVCA